MVASANINVANANPAVDNANATFDDVRAVSHPANGANANCVYLSHLFSFF